MTLMDTLYNTLAGLGVMVGTWMIWYGLGEEKVKVSKKTLKEIEKSGATQELVQHIQVVAQKSDEVMSLLELWKENPCERDVILDEIKEMVSEWE